MLELDGIFTDLDTRKEIEYKPKVLPKEILFIEFAQVKT